MTLGWVWGVQLPAMTANNTVSLACACTNALLRSRALAAPIWLDNEINTCLFEPQTIFPFSVLCASGRIQSRAPRRQQRLVWLGRNLRVRGSAWHEDQDESGASLSTLLHVWPRSLLWWRYNNVAVSLAVSLLPAAACCLLHTKRAFFSAPNQKRGCWMFALLLNRSHASTFFIPTFLLFFCFLFLLAVHFWTASQNGTQR